MANGFIRLMKSNYQDKKNPQTYRVFKYKKCRLGRIFDNFTNFLENLLQLPSLYSLFKKTIFKD